MTITLRSTKGSPLTTAEMDGNFTTLQTLASTADSDALNALAVAQSALAATGGTVTAASLGLGNVDNTHDNVKPVSSYQSAAIAAAVAAVTPTSLGLGNVNNTSDANKPISTAQAAVNATLAPIASPTFTGTVAGITAAMVGLGNVNNTSDAAKPISTAQAAVNSAQATTNATIVSAALTFQYIFGTGIDGSASLDGTVAAPAWATKSGSNYTLTRDVFATNLTLTSTARIFTNGYRLCGTGILDVSAAGTNAISVNPNTMTGGAGATAGTAGTVGVASSGFSVGAGAGAGSP